MIFNETEEQEKAYLQQVLNIINDTINSTDKSVKEHIDTLQEYKDYLWSNKDIDPHEIRSMRESILNHFARGENVIDKRNRLSNILDIPYFGRIDFKENGSSGKKLPVYIQALSFLSEGRKASKAKRLVGSPDKVNAVIQAAAPGRDVTSIPASQHIATSSSPGSEIPGVPASVIKAIFFPSKSCPTKYLPLSNLLYS